METTNNTTTEEVNMKGRVYPGGADKFVSLVEMLKDYCRNENIEIQTVEDTEMAVLQVRKTGLLRSALGMKKAVTIKIMKDSPDLIIEIGIGEWVSNLVASTVGSLIFTPFLLAGIVGAFLSTGFSNSFENKIDYFLANIAI